MTCWGTYIDIPREVRRTHPGVAPPRRSVAGTVPSMPSNDLGSRALVPPAVAVAAGFALLTLLTHAANFGFVALAGRLLSPGDFGDLVALLGIVMVGLAPGMAVQALTAAGVLGGPALVDRGLGRRLGTLITAVVAVATVGAWALLDLDAVLVLLAVPAAAGILPRTGVNEGLLQGHRRFLPLGGVMLTGALVKLVLGAAAMAVVGDLGTAALAVALGYAAQLACSRRATTGHEAARDTTHGLTDVVYAVVVMGALLVLVHLDAVLAPALLGDLEAGRYGVGVTATRITFWLPQFAVLLWFPRMVRQEGPTALVAGLGGVVALGLVGVGAAVALGPLLATAVFGTELGAVGDGLWRFVWLGTTGLVLQVLTLADLATGRRHALQLLVPALVGVGIALPVTQPTTAIAAVTTVAVVLSVVAAVGVVWGVLAARRPRARS